MATCPIVRACGQIALMLVLPCAGFEIATLRALLGKFLLVAVFVGVLWPYVLYVVATLKAALGNDGAEEERARALRALQARQGESSTATTRSLVTGDDGSASSSTRPGDNEQNKHDHNTATQILRYHAPSASPPVNVRLASGSAAVAADNTPPQSTSPAGNKSSSAVTAETSITQSDIAVGCPEILPLKTLMELLSYERPQWGQGFARAASSGAPFAPAPFPPLRSRLLVCHDMAGGYGEDRRVQGGGYRMAYRMYDWGLIDIFVYFSHNLVTIPPAGWTDVAHRHGTRVFGTFITEWDAGYEVCAKLLSSQETAHRAAERLARIAVDHGFDGWLVNIENKIDPGANIEMMVYFLKTLTAQMRAALPSISSSYSFSTTVLWYDSVTFDGNLAWQNALNSKNRLFFDACDGIYTNYCWKADTPSACALEAEARRLDVYMGIDAYARGTWGGGGFECDKALGKLRRAGVSAALFAPGWTMEEKTSGGGKVDPSKGQRWGGVEQEFEDVNAEFWAKIAAVWPAPRPIPGRDGFRGGGGGVQGAGCPVVVNFGRGVGSRWRICGKEVAKFVAADDDADASTASEKRITTLGGAFYDMASQCLTPLIGARKGPSLWSDVVQARRAGYSSGATGGANGTVGARVTFAESFDGASSLCFTGVLNEKAIATFPLYSCDLPLPAEPLEVRVTFSSNTDSEIALVLMLDIPGHLGGRKEVVLRQWGHEGKPSTRPVFSKRLKFTDSHVAYAPVEEIQHGKAFAGPSAEEALQARVRKLRESGLSYEEIWKQLRTERVDRNPQPPGSGSPTLPLQRGSGGGASGAGGEGDIKSSVISPSTLSALWTTRKYVIRDLRMGGCRAVREIRVVCARRTKTGPNVETLAGRRLEDEGRDEDRGTRQEGAAGGVEQGKQLRGVAGLAAYRSYLGEVVVGPWRREARSTFCPVESLRAVEVSFLNAKVAKGRGVKVMVVDLSLEWKLGAAADQGLEVLHWDVWEAREAAAGVATNAGDSEAWTWLGRAYGLKYRLSGLGVEVGETGKTVLAVQQVNAMGYRQPVQDWAKLELTLPEFS